MQTNKTTLIITALLLLLLGSLHTAWRYAVHQVPFLPGTKHVFWEVEARVEMQTEGKPVKVRLALPSNQPYFALKAEHTASPGFGLNFFEDENRYLEWTRRAATANQWLYYRAQFQQTDFNSKLATAQPPAIAAVSWSASQQAAASQVLKRAWEDSADPFSLAQELARRLSNPNNQNARLLVSEQEASQVLVKLLNEVQVPARVLQGLKLEDSRRNQSLEPLVQVFNGNQWRVFSLSGTPANPEDYLLWQLTQGPILEVEGAHNSKVSFAMLKTSEPASSSVNSLAIKDALLSLSIHSLPLAEQALFKTLLLLPLGALIVVALRIFIGIQTSGTFMPLLIALAFLEMSLASGLFSFLLLVALGLVLRHLLAKLNLLLVARVAAVIVGVIGMIAFLAVIAYHTGLTQGMKVTLFPMIIVAWTIERMSILWEEEGPLEVIKQGGGSLLTAVITYLIISSFLMRYLMFNFLGLQLVVLALILLVGSYTGYRMLELVRFKPFNNHAD